MNYFRRLLCLLPGLLWLQQSIAQEVRVSGVVTSRADAQRVPGAIVRVKGTNIGTQTDPDGKYSINAHEKDTLQVTSLGFEPTFVVVGSNRVINIFLDNSNRKLDEVVVTALGISREKKSLGYAVQELKSKDISEAKETNLVNALAGKIAGVQVTNSQGNLGSSRIVIRGETSIAGNNQPLFVLDGVPVDNSQLGVGTGRDFANAISDLNPDDIAAISVLKGPNAAALYGSRASGGVIVIKTKTGKDTKGGMGVTVNSGVTMDKLLILPDFQNSYGQGTGGQFSYKDGKGGGLNDGVDESWGPKMDGRLIPQFFSNGEAVPFVPHPNNVKDFYVTGYTMNNGLSVGGTSEKIDYRFSYNNTKQQGILPNTGISRNTFAASNTFRLTPKLTLSTYANYVRSAADNLPGVDGRRGNSVTLQFIWFGRQVDVEKLKNYKNPDGTDFNWNHSYYSNPYWIQNENTVGLQRNRFLGNARLSYEINSWLTAAFRIGTDYYQDRRKYRVAYYTNGTPFGSYTEDAYAVSETNGEFTLNAKKKLGSDFDIDVLAGGNLRTNQYEQNYQQAPRLAIKGVYTLNNSRDPLVSYNILNRQKVYSGFASAQVGFRNYAFLNLTARNDWSSTLPVSYFYPSVNASLVLSEALHIQGDALSLLKVRGGWAQVGKDTDPYQQVNTYPFNTPFGSQPLMTVSDKYLNKNIKPEITTSTEVGIEAGFFHNRARVDVTYYNTLSRNQILLADVSASTGYLKKLLNSGELKNHGIEVQLGGTPYISRSGFRWDVNVNYARNVSEVLSLDADGFLNNYVLGSSGNIQVIATKGQRYGALFGGAYARDSEGHILVNASGRPQIDPNKKVLGYFTPKWTGSINNSLSFKGFSLGFLIDTKQGGSIWSGTNSTGMGTGVLAATMPGRDAENGGLPYYYDGTKNVQLPSHDATAPNGAVVKHDGIIFDGYTADGKKNTAILSAQDYYKAVYSSSLNESAVYDASFIKLREIKIGYMLPQSLVQKWGLQAVNIALVGRNLGYLSKHTPNIDPETAFNTGNGQGLETLQIPTTRSFGFNLNVSF
ncbi:TonB-linked outer membrane protein, SusC/RagA family [Chitinophaga terrae (ex Kim and Jung 2007)]|uniref:TonB-linked outer membrane protein, SusC/RagA family n=1 Tax=Chitinophaga terrae (ex Kim and Jung 2007) TaxID=408074 RepID=A0A1H4BSX0_9BACT|nr:SusC/RagA family TonB-linked outer membrane protein [Chitinophaga terrae (ex Kim and Jung 2007)]GEP89743.1 SusC/RagA family TonB-linked outer membrane protein [Chitinophaga terrae (ex Kim and Jung 2007)]SEA50942.1 TonB-linked outer membrane protein, SusC/RagA family [Chitinophaga terrae (ex Kim and Jung 2007)]